MSKLNTIVEFRALIQQIERQKSQERELLMKQIEQTYENLKPINIIKNSMRKFATTTDFKSVLLNTGVNFLVAYFSKKINRK